MDELMTPEQLADYLQVSVKKLANERYLGRGIRFVKIGKAVRYKRSDVEAFIAANMYTRTDIRDES